MLVVPPPPAAVGAFGTAMAGTTPSVLGPTALHILIGVMLTYPDCESTTPSGGRRAGQACYIMAFRAATAAMAAMGAPSMLHSSNDREGAHHGAQPVDYMTGGPLAPSGRPVPPREARIPDSPILRGANRSCTRRRSRRGRRRSRSRRAPPRSCASSGPSTRPRTARRSAATARSAASATGGPTRRSGRGSSGTTEPPPAAPAA